MTANIHTVRAHVRKSIIQGTWNLGSAAGIHVNEKNTPNTIEVQHKKATSSTDPKGEKDVNFLAKGAWAAKASLLN